MSQVISYRPRARLPTVSHRIERTPLFVKRFRYTFAFGIFVSAIPMFIHYITNKHHPFTDKEYDDFIKLGGFNPIHGANKRKY
mmetsp:Transcript_15602/g.16350  ORF Transcript_15602/g.16350 Transcript_15602/m.16350 type:complete len:83 (+) Transcript_15602:81-329(+)